MVTVSNSSYRIGWTIGGGAEYALTNNIIAGVEYDYTDLGRHRITQTDGLGFVADRRVRVQNQALLARVSWKF